MRSKLSFFILLLTIQLQSCKPNNIYFNLADEDREFLLFEVGDTFKLKNVSTDEIVTLTVNFKEFRHEDGRQSGSSFISYGPKANIYVEYGEYTFSDATNCYNGIVTINATREESFELRIFLGGCFLEMDDTYQYSDLSYSSIALEEGTYTNTYLFESNGKTLYYSKEKGIIQIGGGFGTEPLFTLVE